MELELVPLEGEKERARLLPLEERERMKARIKPIPKAALADFSNEQRQQIRQFLFHLISYSEHVHHDMEDTKHITDHREHMVRLHAMRQELFDKAAPAVQAFIKLVDLSPMEPWLEWEVLLHALQREIQGEFYETRNRTGTAAAIDNPFLMQVDDGRDEEQMELSHRGRMTTHDIEQCIFHFELEVLVKQLIQARRVITGEIWEGDYDL